MGSKKTRRGLLLLSGGIDSPVSGYLMKKLGVNIGAIHFSHEPVTDDEAEIKSKKLAKQLGFSPVYVIPFGETLAYLSKTCDHRYYFIIMRRMMLRISERIAQKEGYDFLITGENLGQVGSQTLENMKATDCAVKMHVLRPILCNDKVETINIAEKIGTFEISKGPEICAVLGPKHPVTKAKIETVLDEEKKIDVEKIVEECVGKCRG